jgi:hypothetical protein
MTVGLGSGAMANNIAIGESALDRNTSGQFNVVIGSSAARNITTGTSNIAIGANVLFNSTINDANIGIGYEALASLGTETMAVQAVVGVYYRISFVGTTDWTLYGAPDNIVGIDFTLLSPAIGDGWVIPLSGYNVAIGPSALGASQSVYNSVVIGNAAALAATDIHSVVAIGYQSLASAGKLNQGGQIVAIGSNTLLSLNAETSYGHTAIGYNALTGLMGGTDTTALGSEAGNWFGAAGYGVNALSTATNSIYIGSRALALVDNPTNEIVIGHAALGNGSNTTTIGNASNTATYLTGTLYVNGSPVGGVDLAQLHAVALSF